MLAIRTSKILSAVAVVLFFAAGATWWFANADPTAPAVGREPAKVVTRKPSKPDGPWRQEFHDKWYARGVKLAKKTTWLRTKTVRVIGDEEVPADILAQTAESLKEGLQEIGAHTFRVVVDNRTLSVNQKACIRNSVMDFPCFGSAVTKLRTERKDYAG